MDELVLPVFSLFGPDNDPPRRQKTVAESVITNEHGVQQRVTLVTNHPGTRWWVSAVYVNGWARASGTLSTGSRTKAEAWGAAIRAGRVRIEEAK
jgi:hypothetical protein